MTATGATIERVEYFVGEDPGHGNATELPIPEGQSSVEAELVFPPGSLPDAPRSQITIRALDSEGNWTPPRHVTATNPFRPDDSERTIAGTAFFFPEDSEAPEGTPLTIPSGETVADAEIELPFDTLPDEAFAVGWAQAEDSDGFRGPPVPFLVTAPPPDRFAGREIAEVGAWHYSILDGGDVVAMGTSGAVDDLVAGFDFRELETGEAYTLIVKPVADNGLPILAPAADIDAIRDFEWWQRLHFNEEERGDEEISGPNADPDGSGTTNFERFVGGSAPGETFGGLQSGFELVTEDTATRPLVTLDRSRLAASTTLILEVSENLQSWEEAPAYSIDTRAVDETTDRLEIRPENGEEPNSDKRFYRVRVLE